MKPFDIVVAKNRKLAMKLYLINSVCKKKLNSQFELENLSDDDCLSLFRFSKLQLKMLRRQLHIPWKVICKHKTICTGIEALCILLRRLSYPNRLVDLTFLFKRSWSQIGAIFNFTLNLVFEKFGHLLSDLNQPWLTKEYMQIYADAIRGNGAPLNKCWGFIDGTVRPICRPGKNQKECYNGHKRVHALKYQSVVAPNGIIVNLFGPIEGRRHDAFLLSESGILPALTLKNVGEVEPYCIYGDPAYPLRPELQAPFKGTRLTPPQAAFNKKMSMSRISVEWAFGKILNLFAFVDFKKNQRLYLQPVAKYFKVAALFTNIHTCLNGSQVSDSFNLDPIPINEYLVAGN